MPILTIVSEWWTYTPGLFNPDLFPHLYTEISNLCGSYKVTVYGKEYDSKRMSCYISSSDHDLGYNGMLSFDWTVVPIISEIRTVIEKFLETKYDYCLVHIYRDGNDNIGWHNDKEALDSDIASVSFGATRKFRFRKIGQTTGFAEEILLNNGDLVHMKIGCQRRFKHCVPVEKKVKNPRINLTFRKYE